MIHHFNVFHNVGTVLGLKCNVLNFAALKFQESMDTNFLKSKVGCFHSVGAFLLNYAYIYSDVDSLSN